jgi:hypothetical protein
VFCKLWNQLVIAARSDSDPRVKSICMMMLRSIRRLYVALHNESDFFLYASTTKPGVVLEPPANSYPMCKIDEHRHNSIRVPELPLDGLPRPLLSDTPFSMVGLRELTSRLVPVLPPPTNIPPYPPFAPDPYPVSPSRLPSDIQTVVSRQPSFSESIQYDPVSPAP